jgi:hypothetical protein
VTKKRPSKPDRNRGDARRPIAVIIGAGIGLEAGQEADRLGRTGLSMNGPRIQSGRSVVVVDVVVPVAVADGDRSDHDHDHDHDHEIVRLVGRSRP